MNLRKKVILSSIVTSMSVATLGIGFALGYYKVADSVGQPIGYQGKLNQVSIFLNANIWEADGAIFFMFNNTEGKWHSPSKTINPVINNVTFTMYVFTLESPVDGTTSFTFARVNPDGEHVYSEGQAAQFYFTDSPRTVWNQVDNLTYSNSVNYYCVKTWKGGTGTHNNDEKNDGVETNHLTLNNNGDLVFG